MRSITLLLCLIYSAALVFAAEKEDSHGDLKAMPQGAEEGHGEGHGKKGGHHSWGYTTDDGPPHWAQLYPAECGRHRKRQSPINVKPNEATYDPQLADVDLLVRNIPRNYTLTNNGHTVNMGVTNDIYVSGGKLRAGFKVAGVHFHWGGDNSRGSEHTLDQKSFPLEMHIVNYNAEEFAGLKEALNGTDSLAVLGVIWEVGQENPALNAILDHFPRVQQPDTTVQIPGMDLKTLLPPLTQNYFRYLGSLTTPTCNENVIWTLFEAKNHLSQAQLDKFRQLYFIQDMAGQWLTLSDNYRPPQKLHGRTVSRSFPPPRRPATTPASSSVTISYSFLTFVAALIFNSLMVKA